CSVSGKCLPVSRKYTGSVGSTCATICSSTAESAPNDETMATSSFSTSLTACRSTATPSISSNMPLSAMIPRARSLSGLGCAKARLGIAIERLLERCLAQTAIRGDKRFVGTSALAEVEIDELLDGVGDLLGDKPMTENVADGRVLRPVAPHRNLVQLGALLLDAQHANVAHMVVAARIDAARNLDLQIADLALPLR